MVCSLGGGQMTTLLEGGSTSQIMSEDVGCWKLAAQYIHRELKEADEVNLLDEEDMHVFGLRPMVDPLILVCCNSCKKPVKVSQYATHAEICKSLSSLVDSTTETDFVVPKKPPRKERKKLQISISGILIIYTLYTPRTNLTPFLFLSSSYFFSLFLSYNFHLLHLFLKVVFVELNLKVAQVASIGKPDRCATANTTASNCHVDEKTLKATSFPIQTKGAELLNESHARSVKNFDNVTSRETPKKLNDHHLQTKGMLSVPAPLATKIFYSQRTQRLRSAISHMYYKSSSMQHDHDLSNMQFSEYVHHNKPDEPHEKLGKHVPCMVENTDPVSAKSSEALSDEPGTLLHINFSDQFHVNNSLGPQKTLPNPFPFDEN